MGLDDERKFFDTVAARSEVSTLSRSALERYARPQRPQLFAKEKMFSLLPQTRPLQLLEVGCGEGVVAVQLAHCGIDVMGVDLSPVSIEVARRRAALHRLPVKLEVMDVMSSDLGENLYDVIWCDLILHHLVPSFEAVVAKIWKALKPGGRFIAREPVQYARWLRSLRQRVPVHVDATPDERPLGAEEFAIIHRYFPQFQQKHYRIFARIDRVTSHLGAVAFAARADNVLLRIPGTTSLAGNVVLWADKTSH